MCIIFHNLSSKHNKCLNLWNSNFFCWYITRSLFIVHRTTFHCSSQDQDCLFTSLVFLSPFVVLKPISNLNRNLSFSLLFLCPTFPQLLHPPPLTFLSSFSVFLFQSMHHSFLSSWIWKTLLWRLVCLLRIVENWLILLSSSVLSSLSLFIFSSCVGVFAFGPFKSHRLD